jgi:hypothetical protein
VATAVRANGTPCVLEVGRHVGETRKEIAERAIGADPTRDSRDCRQVLPKEGFDDGVSAAGSGWLWMAPHEFRIGVREPGATSDWLSVALAGSDGLACGFGMETVAGR